MKRRYKFIISLFLGNIFLYLILNSCEHDARIPENVPEICFEQEVLPIFQTGCGITGCHDAQTAEAGYIYTDYASIMKSITPYDPDKSKAYQAIVSIWDEAMPPERPLPLASRTIIRLWIEQGAQQTTCPDDGIDDGGATGVKSVCFQRDILPILQSSCGTTGCHDAATAREGFVFTSYSSTLKAVVANDPLESKLYKVITEDPSEDDFMPPSPYSPLSQAQIDSIYNWIANGAKDEVCATLCDTVSPVTYNRVIASVINNNCKSCHSGSNPSGNVPIENYADTKVIADNGKLLQVIKRISTPMPPSYPLTDCQIRQVELWIEQGTLEN